MSHKKRLIERKRKTFLDCCAKSEALLRKGLDFAANNMPAVYQQKLPFRVELVTNARYLHRGFYCPSLIRDYFLGNARRGRIIKRPTNRTSYSHKYIFNQDGKLQIVESVLPGGKGHKYEYLVHRGNTIWGFAFDSYGALVGLSEENYTNGRLNDYFCASCYVHKKDGLDFGITEMFLEEYDCDENGLYDVTLYHVSPYVEQIENDEELDALIEFSQYRFTCNDGKIVELYSINAEDEV